MNRGPSEWSAEERLQARLIFQNSASDAERQLLLDWVSTAIAAELSLHVDDVRAKSSSPAAATK